jgi:hypothetical protein
MWVDSRNRWLVPEGEGPKGCDNFGFAQWCKENEEELRKLGPGRHYGEFYGRGIGRNYGLQTRHFALFNTKRWGAHNPNTPACCQVVPVLADAPAPRVHALIEERMTFLRIYGSVHVPGFMQPEGIVVYFPGQDAHFKGILDKQGPSPIEGEAA